MILTRRKPLKLDRLRRLLANAFCPTGPGGGVDPTCSPTRRGGAMVRADAGVPAATVARGQSVIESLALRFGAAASVAEVVFEDSDNVDASHGATGAETFGYYDPQRDRVVVAASKASSFQDQTAALDGSTVDASVEGTIRHEIGHSVYEKMPGIDAKAQWEGVHAQVADGHYLSQLARQGPVEYFSEAFSLYSSPDYERGQLPKTAHEFLAGLEKRKTANAFCATGPGGGIDPSCSPGGSSPLLHGTTIGRVKSILKDGILPKSNLQIHAWPGVGEKDKNNKVYVTDSFAVAEFYGRSHAVMSRESETGEEYAVIEIHVPESETTSGIRSTTEGGDKFKVIAFDKIPPSWIKAVHVRGSGGLVRESVTANTRTRRLYVPVMLSAAPRTNNAQRFSPVRLNPLCADPSRCALERRGFKAEIKRRFAPIRRALRDLVAKEDAFGLTENVYDPDQERDESGRWTSVGGVGFDKFSAAFESQYSESIVDDPVREAFRKYLHGGKGGFKSINTELRAGGRPKEVDLLLSRAKPFSEINKALGNDGIVYRGVTSLKAVGLVKGDEFTELGLMSTSTDPIEAGNFATQRGGSTKNAVLRIKPDSNVRAFIGAPGQSEVVLEPGVKLIVTGRRVGKFEGDYQKRDVVILDVVASKGLANNTTNTRWKFSSSAEKLEEFRKWLAVQLKLQGLLFDQVKDQENEWWRRYIQQVYDKGQGRAFDSAMRKRVRQDPDVKEKLDFYAGSKERFLRESFGRPATVDAVKELAARNFGDLKGMSDDMQLKLGRTLSDGLIQGWHPKEVAKGLTETLDISEERAFTIAQTEITRAQSEGQLDALEALGVTEVGVAVEWTTAAGDTGEYEAFKVCEACQDLDGVVLKTSEAHNLLPRHPNCKCAWQDANVGEDKEDQIRSRQAIERALEDSAEKDGGAKSKWAGADIDIDKSRPKSIFNLVGESWDSGFLGSLGRIGLSENDDPRRGLHKLLGRFDDLVNVGDNCGIGPDGFEPGNTCARGGGGVGISSSFTKDSVDQSHGRRSWTDASGQKVVLRLSTLYKKEGHTRDVKGTKQVAVVDLDGKEHKAFSVRGEGNDKMQELHAKVSKHLKKYFGIDPGLTDNAFCATGPGGGVDPSCSPGEGAKGATGLSQDKNDEIIDLASQSSGSMADVVVAELEKAGVRPTKYMGEALVVYRGTSGQSGDHVYATTDKNYAGEFGEVESFTIVGGTYVYPDPQMKEGPSRSKLPHSFIIKRSELINA